MSTPHFPGWYPTQTNLDESGSGMGKRGPTISERQRAAAVLSRARLPSRPEAVSSDCSSSLGWWPWVPIETRATLCSRLPQAVHTCSRHLLGPRRLRNERGFQPLRGLVWPKRSASCAPQVLRWATSIADHPSREGAPF